MAQRPLAAIRRGLVHALDAVGLAAGARRAALRLRCRGIPIVEPTIHRRLPHDAAAFTQGLAWQAGRLYESTGLPDASSLRRLDPASGAVLEQVAVEGVWAEGIAICGDRLIQLTWRDGQALVWSLPGLRRIGALPCDGEGWGLAAMPHGLVRSDGNDRLIHCDGELRTVRNIAVAINGRPLARINDLVFARGRIVANVLFERSLFEIDGDTGAVLRVIDCAGLAALAAPASPDAMLNGIAWDAGRDRFYVTGKLWPALFEVSWPP